VELPLNTSEDRLCAALILSTRSNTGKTFEAGFIHAHGNLLYVDEVNLLSDHIVKALLESAASV
jgi:Mg-chelatase subunit ChlI